MEKMTKPAELSHKARLRFPAVSLQALLVFTVLQLPAVGQCDSMTGFIQNLFATKGKSMSDVATKVIELPEKSGITVSALDFSPDGKLLAVRSAGRTINIWDWQSRNIVRTVENERGANDGLTTEPLKFSPDGRWLVACHGRAKGHVVARIWDTVTWEIAHDIVDDIPGSGCNAIGFTPDGKSLIRVLDRIQNVPGDTLVIYDTKTWQPVWGMRTVPFYTFTLAISPDGKLIALGGVVSEGDGAPTNPQIAIVNMVQRAIVRTIPDTVEFQFGRLAWSPDGANLISIGQRAWGGSANGGKGAYVGSPDTVMIFDPTTGKQIAGGEFGGGHMSLRYTPDGKYLIQGSTNDRNTGWGEIWDGQHRALLQKISGNVGSIAVSKDGRYLATGVDGKTIVWELK